MKILIHGLLNSQQRQVINRFPDVDFVFTDNQKGALTQLPQEDIPVILVTKFSSHQQSNAMHRAFSKVISLRRTEGISSVIREICKLKKGTAS